MWIKSSRLTHQLQGRLIFSCSCPYLLLVGFSKIILIITCELWWTHYRFPFHSHMMPYSHLIYDLYDFFQFNLRVVHNLESVLLPYYNRKSSLFLQYEEGKKSALFRLPNQSNPSLKEHIYYVHSLLQLLRKATVLVNVLVLYATVQMGVLRFKVLILIFPTVC